MAAHATVNFSLGLAFGLVLFSCSGSSPDDGADTVPVDPTATNGTENQVLNVGGRAFSVPSPVLSALALRDAGIAYQRSATLPLERGESLAGRTDQALALGMYGADLAYATVHRDGQRTLAILQAIEKLSGRLELSNAFDKALLERFRNNVGNEDSLLRFSGTAFRAADEYLKTNDRDDVSALVLAGGWIEALHLSLADPKMASSQPLIDRVGEQRSTLDGLVDLLSLHSEDARTAALVASLRELQGEFRSVSTSYTYQEPVTDREARTTYINSTSKVTITPEKLSAIVAKVAAIRSTLLA
jgi:hypothetical protein